MNGCLTNLWFRRFLTSSSTTLTECPGPSKQQRPVAWLSVDCGSSSGWHLNTGNTKDWRCTNTRTAPKPNSPPLWSKRQCDLLNSHSCRARVSLCHALRGLIVVDGALVRHAPVHLTITTGIFRQRKFSHISWSQRCFDLWQRQVTNS